MKPEKVQRWRIIFLQQWLLEWGLSGHFYHKPQLAGLGILTTAGNVEWNFSYEFIPKYVYCPLQNRIKFFPVFQTLFPAYTLFCTWVVLFKHQWIITLKGRYLVLKDEDSQCLIVGVCFSAGGCYSAGFRFHAEVMQTKPHHCVTWEYDVICRALSDSISMIVAWQRLHMSPECSFYLGGALVNSTGKNLALGAHFTPTGESSFCQSALRLRSWPMRHRSAELIATSRGEWGQECNRIKEKTGLGETLMQTSYVVLLKFTT